MAELTAMRNNVLGYPVYGLPYVVAFPILDEDGDPVTGLTPDSEISKNGDTAVDTATEAAEIAFDTAANKGMYQLQLSAAEMTCDVAAITVYTGVATSQATCMVLYPKKLPKILSGTSGAAGVSTSIIHLEGGKAIDDFYNGCIVHLIANTGAGQVRMISDYAGSTTYATVAPLFATAPDDTTTFDVYLTDVAVAPIISLLTGLIPNAVAGAASGLSIVGSAMTLAGDAVDAAALKTDAVTEIVNAVLAGVIEGTVSLKTAHRRLLAALAGKASGGGTGTVKFTDTGAQTKDRITATVDADGNRTAVSYDDTDV